MPVALTVGCDLGVPVLPVLGGSLIVLETSMPEAAVDEDRKLGPGEDDVRRSPQPREWRRVDPIPQPCCMQQAAHHELWLRVAATVRDHRPACALGSRP